MHESCDVSITQTSYSPEEDSAMTWPWFNDYQLEMHTNYFLCLVINVQNISEYECAWIYILFCGIADNLNDNLFFHGSVTISTLVDYCATLLILYPLRDIWHYYYVHRQSKSICDLSFMNYTTPHSAFHGTKCSPINQMDLEHKAACGHCSVITHRICLCEIQCAAAPEAECWLIPLFRSTWSC